MVEEAFSEGELQQFSSHPGNVHHLQIIIINKKILGSYGMVHTIIINFCLFTNKNLWTAVFLYGLHTNSLRIL